MTRNEIDDFMLDQNISNMISNHTFSNENIVKPLPTNNKTKFEKI